MKTEVKNKLSIYHLIVDELEGLIKTGELKPGDALMSESRLAARFTTSRVTVRKALELLVEKNMIFSVPGKGYFVTSPKPEAFKITFPPSGDDFKMTVTDAKIIRADERFAQIMFVTEGTKLLRLRKTYTLNGTLVGWGISYTAYRPKTASVESALRYEENGQIASEGSANIRIRAVKPDENIQKKLAVSAACTVLNIEKTALTPQRDAVYDRDYFISDAVKITGE